MDLRDQPGQKEPLSLQPPPNASPGCIYVVHLGGFVDFGSISFQIGPTALPLKPIVTCSTSIEASAARSLLRRLLTSSVMTVHRGCRLMWHHRSLLHCSVVCDFVE